MIHLEVSTAPTIAEIKPSEPQPAVRAESLLRRLENVWLYLDRLVQMALPPRTNPFGQLGAIANTTLLIAVASGIILLCWYSPSVHQAYASLETIRQSSWLGQLMRSIHRYSSDGCLFFVLMHAARIVCQRRITGPRWLAWGTGLLLLSLLWMIGWTGYWLVWDVRGQHAALGTARFFDALPIFAEPLSRSFLTDAMVPSLLFFLIFFVHMLAPLAVGIGIWLHLARVNRARFIADRYMTAAILVSLVILSAIFPAHSETAAAMAIKAPRFTVDAWYLWPFALTDRLQGGALWAIFLCGGMAGLSAPWWMAKRARSPQGESWRAHVDLPRCMGCTLCAQDCPFNAITMAPRTDGRKFQVQSVVDPNLCVGCGICTGACDSQAINLPILESREVEKHLSAWVDSEKSRAATPYIAFCCGESAGALAFPGYRVQTVPCASWVTAIMVERLLKRGAQGILIVGCGEADPLAREGHKWLDQRLQGRREPAFTSTDSARVRFVKLDRTRRPELLRIATDFQKISPVAPRRTNILGATAVAIAICAITLAFSAVPYRAPHSPEPELVVSFNHSGAILQARKLTKEELEKRLPHMRAQVNVSRERSSVRLRVQIDDKPVFDQSFKPKGLAKDGPSIGTVRLPITAGTHHIRVGLEDGAATHEWDQSVAFEPNGIRVVTFDAKSGFAFQ